MYYTDKIRIGIFAQRHSGQTRPAFISRVRLSSIPLKATIGCWGRETQGTEPIVVTQEILLPPQGKSHPLKWSFALVQKYL